jgi:hypothetical protein
MANAGAKPTAYTDDSGKAWYYPIHAYLMAPQGGITAPATGAGKWPFKRSWLRHIGVLFSDGTRDEIPIMSISNALYTTGGAISITFPNATAARTGVVTGRRGEKMHLAHT